MPSVSADMGCNRSGIITQHVSARSDKGIERTRPQEVEAPFEPDRADERRKRARTSALAAPIEEDSKPSAANALNDDDQNPIKYWSEHGRWPEEYFEQSSKMDNILARKRSRTSLSHQSSDAGSVQPSSTTASDQKPREVKSAPYRNLLRYKKLLQISGSFMEESDMGITEKSQQECSKLLNDETEVPQISLFRDDIFQKTCRMIQDRNESKVMQDITRLIVPSAETLAIYGADSLDCLIESVNEGWNDSVLVTKTRPQPDYAVGFRMEAFTEDRLSKLQPFVGDVTDYRNESYFMATYYMYFPFLTCEVKCSAAALDIADRQNAHSMTIAVRAVVELFRYVSREKELDREILAFSITHDHHYVKIFGHYAVIEGKSQKYYRHPIHTFDITALGGRDKWTAYKFTKNVYETWMPNHFKRICSAIDAFPSDVNFDLSEQSELQDFEAYRLAQSSAGSGSAQAQADDQSSVADAQRITPNTSMNEVSDSGPSKRPRKDRG